MNLGELFHILEEHDIVCQERTQLKESYPDPSEVVDVDKFFYYDDADEKYIYICGERFRLHRVVLCRNVLDRKFHSHGIPYVDRDGVEHFSVKALKHLENYCTNPNTFFGLVRRVVHTRPYQFCVSLDKRRGRDGSLEETTQAKAFKDSKLFGKHQISEKSKSYLHPNHGIKNRGSGKEEAIMWACLHYLNPEGSIFKMAMELIESAVKNGWKISYFPCTWMEAHHPKRVFADTLGVTFLNVPKFMMPSGICFTDQDEEPVIPNFSWITTPEVSTVAEYMSFFNPEDDPALEKKLLSEKMSSHHGDLNSVTTCLDHFKDYYALMAASSVFVALNNGYSLEDTAKVFPMIDFVAKSQTDNPDVTISSQFLRDSNSEDVPIKLQDYYVTTLLASMSFLNELSFYLRAFSCKGPLIGSGACTFYDPDRDGNNKENNQNRWFMHQYNTKGTRIDTTLEVGMTPYTSFWGDHKLGRFDHISRARTQESEEGTKKLVELFYLKQGEDATDKLNKDLKEINEEYQSPNWQDMDFENESHVLNPEMDKSIFSTETEITSARLRFLMNSSMRKFNK